jgi:TRAP-type uncharacterized transport system fused permease subunit
VPGLVLVGTPADIIRNILMAFIGIFVLTIATEGWLYRRVNVIWRIVMIPVSFMLFMPQLVYNIVSIAMLAGFIVYEKLRGKVD